MNDILDGVTLGEPVFLRNLLVYPLRGASDNDQGLRSIEEIIDIQGSGFRELETADINLISFDNKTGDPVLLLDGEEITGALQNRIIAATTYTEPHTKRNIDVICAEEGRWSELGAFMTGHCSYPAIRAILSRGGKEETDLQKNVWQEIERKLTATKTLSSTSSMHDIYDNLQDEVERYLEDFESLNHDTCGFIGVAGGNVLGCDIFHNASTYGKFERKLLRSYALDALEHRKPEAGSRCAADFFEEIKRALAKKLRTGRSGHFSFKSGSLSGQGIVRRNKMIHTSVFRS